MQTIIKYFHPLVWIILSGTIFARTASFMAMPFLALYLHNQLHASPLVIGLTLGVAPLFGTFGGLFGGYFTDRFGRKIVIIRSYFLHFLSPSSVCRCFSCTRFFWRLQFSRQSV